MAEINYEQKKADLETWFRWHEESHPFWTVNRGEYVIVCEILKLKKDDNNRLSK